jgi:hypothetical protein
MVIVLVACVIKRCIRDPGSVRVVSVLQKTNIVFVHQIKLLQRIK